MANLYELARLVAVLPADYLKDLYWRSWKAKVFLALDSAAAAMQAFVNHLGLLVKVCHSSYKRGATIYLEYGRIARKWVPSNLPRSHVPPTWPADRVHVGNIVSWPLDEVSPANAYRLQEIIMIGLPSGIRKPSRKVREIPHAHQTTRVTATVVPLCSLPIFELMNISWGTILPSANDPRTVPYQTVKHRYKTSYRSVIFEPM
jgi:hypothetical protein